MALSTSFDYHMPYRWPEIQGARARISIPMISSLPLKRLKSFKSHFHEKWNTKCPTVNSKMSMHNNQRPPTWIASLAVFKESHGNTIQVYARIKIEPEATPIWRDLKSPILGAINRALIIPCPISRMAMPIQNKNHLKINMMRLYQPLEQFGSVILWKK